MHDEAEAETTDTLTAPSENGGQQQRWPIWLAAGIAAVAAVAAVVSVVAWQEAEQSAADAAASVAAGVRGTLPKRAAVMTFLTATAAVVLGWIASSDG